MQLLNARALQQAYHMLCIITACSEFRKIRIINTDVCWLLWTSKPRTGNVTGGQFYSPAGTQEGGSSLGLYKVQL